MWFSMSTLIFMISLICWCLTLNIMLDSGSLRMSVLSSHSWARIFLLRWKDSSSSHCSTYTGPAAPDPCFWPTDATVFPWALKTFCHSWSSSF